MLYEYNKDEIKRNLSLEQVEDFLNDFDAEPTIENNVIVAKTVCHNNCGCGSHKLYYYPNTNLFKCYTDCGETFDIFELTRKIMSREHPKAREDSNWNLPEAIDYVARKFGYSAQINTFDNPIEIQEDLKLFEKYDRIKNIDTKTQIVELDEYDGTFLKHLPHPKIESWLAEGITQEVMDNHGICYDPLNCGIVIPHYDINNRLVGIRERTLIKENEIYGKYRPAYISKKLYNHPLSFNLYNINHSKENISRMKKAFVFEGEKSTLLYASYFGEENDLSVAVCGSSFINYQAWLLINTGANEIIVCLDKQFQEVGDNEFQKLIKNLKNIHLKYGKYVTISYLFDKDNLLGYKESPIDRGKDIFLKLYERRVNLYAG